MRLVGFNFSKINAEKISDKLENLKINTGIDIAEIKEVKSNFFKTKEELIGVKFEYKVDYEPGIAKLNFLGNMILSVDSKEAKEVLKEWNDKKIPETFKLTIFNIILKRSSLKALQLEDEFNLPPHVPLPSIKAPETNK